VEGLQFRAERMREAISPDMFATDLALEQAVRGVPFRTAYHDAKQAPGPAEGMDPAASLARRVSPGACADLMLEHIRERLQRQLELAGVNA
jgi:argininosuccinate lyase